MLKPHQVADAIAPRTTRTMIEPEPEVLAHLLGEMGDSLELDGAGPLPMWAQRRGNFVLGHVAPRATAARTPSTRMFLLGMLVGLVAVATISACVGLFS